MIHDILMVVHGVLLWIVFSFWCILTFVPVEREYNTKYAIGFWWFTTTLTGVLATTFYVFQMR